MGPGAALDDFMREAKGPLLGIGPDGAGNPGKYYLVAVVVRDRGELRGLRVTQGIRAPALAVWLDEGTSALSFTPRPEWPALQLIRSRPVDGGWMTVLRFAGPVPVHRVVAELGQQAVWPDHAGQRGVVLEHEATDKVPGDRWEVAEHDPVLALGPLGERVLNPVDFQRDADGKVRDLSDLDWGRVPTVSLVRSVRGVSGDRAQLPTATALLAART